MLQHLQKNAFRTGLILSSILLGVFLLCGYILFRAGLPARLTDPSYLAAPPEFLRQGMSGSSLLHMGGVLGGVLMILLLSPPCIWWMRNLYWRTGSLEVFYFALMASALSLEGLRLALLLLFVRESSLELQLILTRLVYLGRIFGLLAMLTSSLYAVGMKYGNHGLLIGILFLLSFTLASILPLDATAFTPELLYRLGDRQGYRFLTVALQIIFVLNYAGASLLRASPRFLWLALAAALISAGREVLLQGHGPLVAGCGVALLAGGTLLFHRQLGLFYLWI